jgi:alkylation response protein AidB-like acyl-CoA dehydrogenase
LVLRYLLAAAHYDTLPGTVDRKPTNGSGEHAGSDLSSIATKMAPQGGEWHVTGTKWFVSPGPAADVVLAL